MPPVRTNDADDTQYNPASPNEPTNDPSDDQSPPAGEPMTYTFSADNSAFAFASHSIAPHPPVASTSTAHFAVPREIELPLPTTTQPRTSHSRRRDASYIPRPPNAFILFRSSFIRSQQVTGKVEGNHSNLSKIIGLYWKTLPKAERDEWEAKAVVAQAEHRKRYPDWRFRPGATTVAQLQFQDSNAPTRRRRVQGAKDPPDGDLDDSPLVTVDSAGDGVDVKGKGKGRPVAGGKTRGKGKHRSDRADGEGGEKRENADKIRGDQRLAKIADFLVEGKKGVELEVAIQEWELGRDSTKRQAAQKDPTSMSGYDERSRPYNVNVFSSEPSVPRANFSGPPSVTNSAAASPLHPYTADPVSQTGSPTTTSSWPATPMIGSAEPSPISATPVFGAQDYARQRSISRSPRHPTRPDSRFRGPEYHEREGSPSGPTSFHDPLPYASPNSSVPLTQLYRRSFSIPAPHDSTLSPSSSLHQSAVHGSAGEASDNTSMMARTYSHAPPYHQPLFHHPRHARLDSIHLPLLVPRQSLRQREQGLSAQEESSNAPYSDERGGRLTAYDMRPRRAMTWQEVEDRRRMEVEEDPNLWWRQYRYDPHERSQEPYDVGNEPARHGSFDAGNDKEGALGYPSGGYHEGLPSPAPPEPPPPANDGSHVVNWAAPTGRRGLVNVNLHIDTTLSGAAHHSTLANPNVLAHHTTPASPKPPFAPHVSPQEVSAGNFFYPAAPEPPPPVTPLSSFSSLAGWDGEAKPQSSRVDTGFSSRGPSSQLGTNDARVSSVDQGVWHADPWGHVQPLGLQDGGVEWRRSDSVDGHGPWLAGDRS